MEDNRIVFRLGFTCGCGNDVVDKFLLQESKNDETSVILLCLICESRYAVGLNSRKVAVGDRNG